MNRPKWLICVVCFFSGCGAQIPVSTSETSDTGPATDTDLDTLGTGGSTETSDTTTELDFSPFYGPWYAIDSYIIVNDSMNLDDTIFSFLRLDLQPGAATLYLDGCGSSLTWELGTFEYKTRPDGDGNLLLEPVGDELSMGGTDVVAIFVTPGSDCTSLSVNVRRTNGDEHALFPPYGGRFQRGEVCMEYCPHTTHSEYGLISDCGTPVPWTCMD